MTEDLSMNRVLDQLESIQDQLRKMTEVMHQNISAHSTSITRLEEKLAAHEERDGLLHQAIDLKFLDSDKDLGKSFRRIELIESSAFSDRDAVNAKFKIYENLQQQTLGATKLWRMLVAIFSILLGGIEFYIHVLPHFTVH